MGSGAYPQALARGGASLAVIGAGGILASLAFVRHPDPHLSRAPVVAILLGALVAAAVLWRFGPRWSAARLTASAFLFSALIAVGVGLVGPGHQQGASAIAAMFGPMFFFLPRRAAALVTGLSLAVYGAFLASADGYPDPVARWGIVASVSAASAVVMTWISDRLRVLAVAERNGAAEVARLNELLATRVDDLGRFLSPHVAAAVRDAGDRTILEPHRRQVAVMFVDLRGFTKFSAGVEPEEVVDVLRQYYATVGDLAHRWDASIGAFIGDGVMAYFGDPVALEDPAGAALDVALRLRLALEDLRRAWTISGYELGYGIGIAYGYATLGVVGYEARREYTALGTVVNLASRLCGEAADGEILLDNRARAALDGRVETETRSVTLKGFPAPLPAHVVAAPDQRPSLGSSAGA